MPRPVNTGAGTVVHRDWAANNRPAATSVLEDRCTITRRPADSPTGPVMNTVTGQKNRAPVVVAVDLACRVSYDTNTTRRGTFAEETVESARHLVELPWSHTDIAKDDVITITCSGDPGQLGRRYKVLKGGAATYMWSRLVHCEHVE